MSASSGSTHVIHCGANIHHRSRGKGYWGAEECSGRCLSAHRCQNCIDILLKWRPCERGMLLKNSSNSNKTIISCWFWLFWKETEVSKEASSMSISHFFMSTPSCEGPHLCQVVPLAAFVLQHQQRQYTRSCSLWWNRFLPKVQMLVVVSDKACWYMRHLKVKCLKRYLSGLLATLEIDLLVCLDW